MYKNSLTVSFKSPKDARMSSVKLKVGQKQPDFQYIKTVHHEGSSAGWPQCAPPAGFHGPSAVRCSHGDSVWYVDFILALQSLQLPFRSQDE